MNTTLSEATDLANAVRATLGNGPAAEVVLCPPFISLLAVVAAVEGNIGVGAQNLHWAEKGAYTGEISASMLQGLCQYVIIGHSERRQYFGETDEDVARKIVAAQAAGITPIVCVGEQLAQREAGETNAWVEHQITVALQTLTAEMVARLIVAYEPIWAIGTGRAATPAMAEETIAAIRGVIATLHGHAVAEAVRVLYGGSVTAANFASFAAQPNIDGALVGGASLKAAEFCGIVATYTA